MSPVVNPSHGQTETREPSTVMPFVKDISRDTQSGFKDFRPVAIPADEPVDELPIPEDVKAEIDAEFSEGDELDPTLNLQTELPPGLEDLQNSSSSMNPGESEQVAGELAPVAQQTPIPSSPSVENPPPSAKQSANFAPSVQSVKTSQTEQIPDGVSGLAR